MMLIDMCNLYQNVFLFNYVSHQLVMLNRQNLPLEKMGNRCRWHLKFLVDAMTSSNHKKKFCSRMPLELVISDWEPGPGFEKAGFRFSKNKNYSNFGSFRTTYLV